MSWQSCRIARCRQKGAAPEGDGEDGEGGEEGGGPPGAAQRSPEGGGRKRKASGDVGGGGGAGGAAGAAGEDSAEGGGARRQPSPDHVLQRYSGHRNIQTVKVRQCSGCLPHLVCSFGCGNGGGPRLPWRAACRCLQGVSFFGMRDEYVVSGSDCGHVFIWWASCTLQGFGSTRTGRSTTGARPTVLHRATLPPRVVRRATEGGNLLRVLKGDQWVVGEPCTLLLRAQRQSHLRTAAARRAMP